MKRFLSYEEMESILIERQKKLFPDWNLSGYDDGSVMRVFDSNMMECLSAKPGLKSDLAGQQSFFT